MRSGSTLVEWILLAAFAAAVAFLLVPDVARVRDGVRVELAARALARCDEVVAVALANRSLTNRADATLPFVESYFEKNGAPALVWPDAADLSTLDFSGTNGVTVVVSTVRGDSRVVSARALEIDHAN